MRGVIYGGVGDLESQSIQSWTLDISLLKSNYLLKWKSKTCKS